MKGLILLKETNEMTLILDRLSNLHLEISAHGNKICMSLPLLHVMNQELLSLSENKCNSDYANPSALSRCGARIPLFQNEEVLKLLVIFDLVILHKLDMLVIL